MFWLILRTGSLLVTTLTRRCSMFTFRYLFLLPCFLLTTVCGASRSSNYPPAEDNEQGAAPIRVEGRYMVDEDGKRVWLTGFQVPWLFVKEGRSVERHREFVTGLGESSQQFYDMGFDAWFTAEDVKRIKDMGANCIRLTTVFWTFEEEPFKYSQTSFKRLDRAIEECGKQGLFVILSCNSAPGGQNPAGHGGAGGKNEYWHKEEYRARYASMWKEIARRYRGSTAIAGYDVMNEPVPPNSAALQLAYEEIVDAIRSEGDRHIIFLQFPLKASIDFAVIDGENIAYSFHLYAPTEFTHQKVPGTGYPGNIRDRMWNQENLEKLLRRRFLDKALRDGLCLWVGEFGAVDTAPGGSQIRWVEDCLSLWKKLEIGWSYYLYKVGNPGRSFALYKPAEDARKLLPVNSAGDEQLEKNTFDILRTENFIENKKLTDLMKKHMRDK